MARAFLQRGFASKAHLTRGALPTRQLDRAADYVVTLPKSRKVHQSGSDSGRQLYDVASALQLTWVRCRQKVMLASHDNGSTSADSRFWVCSHSPTYNAEGCSFTWRRKNCWVGVALRQIQVAVHSNPTRVAAAVGAGQSSTGPVHYPDAEQSRTLPPTFAFLHCSKFLPRSRTQGGCLGSDHDGRGRSASPLCLAATMRCFALGSTAPQRL